MGCKQGSTPKSRGLSSTERSRKYRQDPAARAKENALERLRRRGLKVGVTKHAPLKVLPPEQVVHMMCTLSALQQPNLLTSLPAQPDRDPNVVYGELHSHFACQLLDELRLSQRSTFVHLGCGFGKLVTQAAMQTGCRSYGVESQPSLWAEAISLAQAARQRCQQAGALFGPLIIEHAEIFSGIHVQRCMEAADVVFINNQGFAHQANARIYQESFPILKRGAVVVTTYPLTPSSIPQAVCWTKEEHARKHVRPGDIDMSVKQYPPGSVSWTSCGGVLYIHRVRSARGRPRKTNGICSQPGPH